MVNRNSLTIYQFIATFVLSSCILYHLQSPHIFCNALATNNNNNNNKSKTYNYFAFGSNMCTSTMINLRGIQPISSTAAVLPKHRLRFNIPGVPFIEPSSASVEPTNNDEEVVHGVLYKLSEEDFGTICSSEGVPFAYSLHRCRVMTYLGDGRNAGYTAAMQKVLDTDSDTDTNNNIPISNSEQSTDTCNYEVSAITLRAARKEWRQRRKDIPPSQAYLNVLLRGANEFSLDKDYVQKLNSVKVGRTLGNGLAEGLLRVAEQRNRFNLKRSG